MTELYLHSMLAEILPLIISLISSITCQKLIGRRTISRSGAFLPHRVHKSFLQLQIAELPSSTLPTTVRNHNGICLLNRRRTDGQPRLSSRQAGDPFRSVPFAPAVIYLTEISSKCTGTCSSRYLMRVLMAIGRNRCRLRKLRGTTKDALYAIGFVVLHARTSMRCSKQQCHGVGGDTAYNW